jgi:ATP-dependent Clp protease adaptor protein ClpS
MVRQKSKPAKKTENLLNVYHDLVLYNDDINTFEFVIESLVEVCGHEFEQAEQCALIAHFQGQMYCKIRKL